MSSTRVRPATSPRPGVRAPRAGGGWLAGVLRPPGQAIGRVVARPDAALVGLLVAFALAARLVVATTVPAWQGPDEPKLFELARLLVDKRAVLWSERRFLHPDDISPGLEREILASMTAHHFWDYVRIDVPAVPPTNFVQAFGDASSEVGQRTLAYYSLAALALLPFPSATIDVQLLVVRCVSVLLSTLTVLVTYLIGRETAPDDRFIAVAGAALVAALPMHAFMGGVVNNDNAVSAAGAAVALGLAVCLRRGFTAHRWAFLVVSLLIALLAKRTAVALLPGIGLALGFWLCTRRLRQVVAASLACAAGVVVGVVLVWRDVAGVGHLLYTLAFAYAPYRLGRVAQLLTLPWTSPTVLLLIRRDLRLLFWSFWGILGWFNLPLDDSVYRLLTAVSALLAVALLADLALGWARRSRIGVFPQGRTRTPRITVMFLVLAASAVVVAVLERLPFLSLDQVPQGRYLFVVVAPIAILYAQGARVILPRRLLGTAVPALAWVIALIFLDVVVYTQYVLPFYYGPGRP